MAHTSRRDIVAGTASLGSLALLSRPARAATYSFVQYHNQASSSPLHRRLVDLWDAVRAETDGRVQTVVFAENNKVKGSDPAALKMLVAGEIQFFTLMGGILGQLAPVAEVQQVPFAFKSEEVAFKAVDGPLGAYLRAELAAKGVHAFPICAFDNGMRQMSCTWGAITGPDSLTGLKMRVPAGQLFADTFRAFGAEPVTINVDGIYDGLKTGLVDGQENPLAVIDVFRIYEVQKFISMTNHMWSGFNLLAHRPTWIALPDDVRAVIDRNVTKYVRWQRDDERRLNAELRTGLAQRGVVFNDVDSATFRARLDQVYAKWRARLGPKCWSLLEAEVGRLG